MNISEIKEIKAATNYVTENQNQNQKDSNEKIISLFSNKQFYNSSSSAESVQEEINLLQSYISQKNNEYEQKAVSINLANKELNELNQKLNDEISEVTQLAEKEENEQKKQIQTAVNEVNRMYMNGDIEKEDMSGELSRKISAYSSLSSGVTSKVSKLNSTKMKISALTSKIASLIDAANNIESELNTANGTLSLMENLKSKMVINCSVNSAAEDSENKTSAIGFSVNGKTCNFVSDKNSDNKLNNKSELLGYENGFDELKNLDTDNDNVISSDELGKSNMFVLMTDNQTNSKKFMSLAETGISSIDLSTVTSEDFSELEAPEVKNIFTVNTVFGVSVQGSDEYEIEDIDNTAILLSIDDYALKNARNIFSKALSHTANGLDENNTNAALSVKSAQAEVKKTSNEMANNNRTASSKLTKSERPETKEEKEAREKEEAEIKAKEEKEAEEKKKAEEEKIKAEEELKEKEEKEIKAQEEKEAKEAEEKEKSKTEI